VEGENIAPQFPGSFDLGNHGGSPGEATIRTRPTHRSKISRRRMRTAPGSMSYATSHCHTHSVDMYRSGRCFSASLLPCHPIAGAVILRCPFCQLIPYRRFDSLKNPNSPRRIDPAIASSTSSATFVYTNFMKKVWFRGRIFSL